MLADGGRHAKLLIVNPGAGGVGGEVAERLRRAFPGYHLIEFPPESELASLLTEEAVVVAAGGDGTVGAVARMLAGTRHSFGILPMGTYNNFARSLRIPLDLEEAIQVVRAGRPRPVTLGRVNGRTFVEAAAVGLFGEAIALGEVAKELHYGEVAALLKDVAGARPFRYRVSGDARLRGRALSIVAANTPSTGALVPVADSTPEEPALELSIAGAAGPGGVLRRLAGMLLRRPPTDRGASERVRRVRVETDQPVRVYADAAEAGETPAEIEAVPAGLSVLMPA